MGIINRKKPVKMTKENNKLYLSLLKEGFHVSALKILHHTYDPDTIEVKAVDLINKKSLHIYANSEGEIETELKSASRLAPADKYLNININLRRVESD